MCGLAGVMGDKLSLADIMKFKDLMTLSQLRGDEGAGIISVPKKTNISHVKVRRTTWSSGHLVTTSDFSELVKGDVSMLIGHARQPTKGGTKLDAVHPHHKDGIYLVHNGTMTSVDNKTVGPGESDSKLVTRCIAEKGIQYFVDNAWGAYCLVWVDLGKQTLNFLRNSERPLQIALQRIAPATDSMKTHMWWASELWMIQTALGRYSTYDKDRIHYQSLPINEHWEFPLNTGYKIQDPKVTKVQRTYQIGYSNSVYQGADAWEHWEGGNQDVVPFVRKPTAGTSVSSANSTSALGTSEKFTYIPPEYRKSVTPMNILKQSKLNAELAVAAREAKEAGPPQKTFQDFATSLADYECKTEKEAIALIGHRGCVWCDERPPIIAGHTPRIYPVRFGTTRGEYVCSTCINDTDIQRMVGLGT